MGSPKLFKTTIKDDIKTFGPTTTLDYAVQNEDDTTGGGSSGASSIAMLWVGGKTPDLSNLRPTGVRATVMVSGYNAGVEEHVQIPAAEGNLEYVDDFTDASKATYTIEMSKLQTSYPQNQKVSFIVNALDTAYQAGWTNIGVLQKACSLVGMTVGRCDIPLSNIVGTFDVVNKSVVELAQELISPWDVLESKKFFIRVEYNLINIILIDFKGGSDASAHSPAYDIGKRAISIERHFSMFIPKTRIGAGQNIFLQGGTTVVPIPDTPTDPTKPAPTPAGPQIITFVQEFDADSKDSVPIGNNGNFDKWTVKAKTMQLSVTVTNGLWDDVAGPDTTIFNLPSITPAHDPKTGAELNPTVNVSDSCILSEETKEYDSVNGLTKDTKTQYSYTFASFSSSSEYNKVNQKRVLLSDQTTTYAYAGKQQIPISNVFRYYGYSASGGLLVTSTYTYLYSPPSTDQAGGWKLTDLASEWADNFDVVLPPLTEPSTGNPNFHDFFDGQVTGLQTIDLTAGTPKGTVEKYQTFNNKPMYLWLQNLDEIAIETGKLPNISVADTLTMAFTASIPYGDYASLGTLYSLLVQAQVEASTNGFWEDISVTIPYDLSPTIGYRIAAGDVSGICVGFEHVIDKDQALTKVMLRTLEI